MEAIAAAIKPMPLNIMAVPNLPPMDTLHKHGVRRLSAGSAIAQAALGCARHLAADFLAGTMSEMFGAAAEYGAVNQLFVNNAHE
jgi:2-methylisocitrate lyase-like PEP mutase family enzyme